MIGPLLQTTLSLLVVLAIILGGAYLVRKLQRNIPGQLSLIHIRSIQSVGTREKIALVEVAGSWILLGITQHQISHLHTLSQAPVVPTQDLKEDAQSFVFKKYLDNYLQSKKP